MEIPEEILKPTIAAIGAAVLVGMTWIFRRLVVSPAKWVRGIAELPASVGQIAEGMEALKSACAKHGLCLEVMLANGTYGTFECDIHGNNIAVNDTYCRMVGAMPSELHGRGWEFFIDSESREKYYEEWHGAMEVGRDYAADLDLRHRDGTVVPVRIRTSKLIEAGAVVGYLGFVKVRLEP